MTCLSFSANQVAFSASLVSDGALTLGPYTAHTTLVYKYVVTNIGNAYNPLTGNLTEPVSAKCCFCRQFNRQQLMSHRYFHGTDERSLPV